MWRLLLLAMALGLIGCDDSQNQKEAVTDGTPYCENPIADFTDEEIANLVAKTKDQEEDTRHTREILRVVVDVLVKHRDELEVQGISIEVRDNYLALWKGEPRMNFMNVIIDISEPMK